MKSDLALTDAEVDGLVPGQDGNHDKSPESEERRSHADRLLRLVASQGVELFRDQYGTPFARIYQDGHGEILKCAGMEFRNWMAGLYWKHEEKAINTEALRTATNVLSAQARFDGQAFQLHNRVALKDGSIWYDLADEKWRAIRITAERWEIADRPPILFRRYNHQRAQIDPIAGGTLRDLFLFTNLASASQELLLLVLLVSYLVLDIPHPILVVHGPQGSAKTTHLRTFRRLIDPSKTETLSLPHDRSEPVQQLGHHYTAAYDNVSHIPEWTSDALCRAVTGEGHSKRELYTDDDDVIYQFRRCISLNGINVAVQKPDLVNRSILTGLQVIPDERRRDEESYYREFEEARPKIFGAMLDTLSRAIALVNSVRLSGLPRMADFCRCGCAISQALGFGQKAFLEAFLGNAGLGHEEVLSGSQVAHATQSLVQSSGEWEGTPQDLYRELNLIAQTDNLNTRTREWPKAANSLTRRLNVIAPDLQAIGIYIKTGGRTGERRKVTIHRATVNTVTTVIPSPSPDIPLAQNNLPDSDDSDGIFRNTVEPEEKPTPPQVLAGWQRLRGSMCPVCKDVWKARPGPNLRLVCMTCHPPYGNRWPTIYSPTSETNA